MLFVRKPIRRLVKEGRKCENGISNNNNIIVVVSGKYLSTPVYSKNRQGMTGLF